MLYLGDLRKSMALSGALLLLISMTTVLSAQIVYAQIPLSGQIRQQALSYPSSVPQPAPCVSWSNPDVQPRVALLCIHGLGLHKGTYEALGKKLGKEGIVTYALDMRGFGESIETKKRTNLDFDGCMADIKLALEQIKRTHPGLPVIVLGESMGGAIALRSAALYPDLVSGLISCVPAHDRFSLGESALKVGVHAITSGFSAPIENVGEIVVKRATSKPDLQRRLRENPLVRLTFSPNELLQFDSFMSKNLEFAGQIKNMPALFIMGAKDKLIRPAGTWKVFEHVSSSRRQLVLSGNSEHLIFEEGQFNPEDVQFVVSWINQNFPQQGSPSTHKEALPIQPSVAPSVSPAVKTSIASSHKMEVEQSISYWIEMYRDGKTYRCNNKLDFKSGDIIRFHVIPETDGYAYLIMKSGSTGKSKLLFPTPESGMDNYLHRGTDYAIPSSGWMQFDTTPGTEHLSLIFSNRPVDITPDKPQPPTVVCYVTSDSAGAKDLVPTRMKLSWNDPNPVLIPDDFSGVSQITAASGGSSSLVRVTSETAEKVVGIDIALMHH